MEHSGAGELPITYFFTTWEICCFPTTNESPVTI